MRLIGGPGQENDIRRAEELIHGLEPDHVLADKAYDADIHKERNRIERLFNKLKHFRRVATRYDKLLANVMGFGAAAAIAIPPRRGAKSSLRPRFQ